MDRGFAHIALRWYGFALIALLFGVLTNPVDFAMAQVSSPVATEESMYVDPANRFAVPIPTNWKADEEDGYVRIVTNDGKIVVFAAMIEAPGATPGIDAVMRMIDPKFESAELNQVMATPAATTDENALYTFDDGTNSGELVQALGQKAGDEVFVLVLKGDLETVKLRQVQVDKIFAGVLIRVQSDATPVASPTS